MYKKIIHGLSLMLAFVVTAHAALMTDLQQLLKAYPDSIQAVNEQYICWKDGTKMAVLAGSAHQTFELTLIQPSLADQLQQYYPAGKPDGSEKFPPKSDPGRIRNDGFFKKMYGGSPQQVKQHLTTIYWLPRVFGQRYPLQVTTINRVNEKLQAISNELEKLPAVYYKFLANPAGTFYWRTIANTNRLSPHSFGIAIDINTRYSNYWQWDLKKSGLAISEGAALNYRNQIPWAIVAIFEKHGFIWGGKWYHYDTMHFEYRPELLLSAQKS